MLQFVSRAIPALALTGAAGLVMAIAQVHIMLPHIRQQCAAASPASHLVEGRNFLGDWGVCVPDGEDAILPVGFTPYTR